MKRSVLIGVLSVGLGLAGGRCLAHQDHPEHMPEPDDVIAFRHYLMENVGANAKELKKKIDAGELENAVVNAQTLAIHSTRVTSLFPPGSVSDSSRAEDTIWEQWEQFVEASHALGTAADQLAVSLGGKQTNQVGGQLKAVFGTCKGCHDRFRKPEEK